MEITLSCKELVKLGLWDEVIKIRKIRNPQAFEWGILDNTSFTFYESDLKDLNIGLTVKDAEFLVVGCGGCNEMYRIHAHDVEKYYLCPSCGDKM